MIVFNEKCKKCNKVCNAIYFQRNFKNWTSGNGDVDKFIRDVQLLVHDYRDEILEWIPYDMFFNIECIAKYEFCEMYSANWINGCIRVYDSWDNKNQNWKRYDQNMFVILKNLCNSENVTLEFINEV
jgi:hypothetical protein